MVVVVGGRGGEEDEEEEGSMTGKMEEKVTRQIFTCVRVFKLIS